MYKQVEDTICALSSAPGVGAIALIRLSGKDALKIGMSCFRLYGKESSAEPTRPQRAYYGSFYIGDEFVDEVMLLYFQSPRSYTGEDLVEISCHGSLYIQQRILEGFVERGARYAQGGEFTYRAFMNGKMDLSQAEAVADLISSHSKSSNLLALSQLRGGYCKAIQLLRSRLLHFAALLELELDFSEEDLEFVDRGELFSLLEEMQKEIGILLQSFRQGNAIRKGIPVAIVGKPNVGKSTLLNTLLNEDRAIVSEIAGTTRDTIEDLLQIEGVSFRLIDTAGLRHSQDQIENYGIERSFQAIERASLVLYLFDSSQTTLAEAEQELKVVEERVDLSEKSLLLVANKCDLDGFSLSEQEGELAYPLICLSAKQHEHIDSLRAAMLRSVQMEQNQEVLLSNVRHYNALSRALSSLETVRTSLCEGLPADLVTIDMRQALQALGEITGQEIQSDEILGNLFSSFCIGK